MAEIWKDSGWLNAIRETLWTQYKEATDKQDISDSYDRWLAMDEAVERLKSQQEEIERLISLLKEYEKLNGMNQPDWKDASIRPPKEGRYIVWGLHEFTPDHCDEPNAYWQTRIANWSNRWGWDTKVKYWRELPEPPDAV